MAQTDESTKQIIAPCIHMNGTSSEDLLDAIEQAYTAIGQAYDELRKTAPNSRDYYVYDNRAYERARDEHYSRLLRLSSVRDELEELCGAINNGEKFATVRVQQ